MYYTQTVGRPYSDGDFAETHVERVTQGSVTKGRLRGGGGGGRRRRRRCGGGAKSQPPPSFHLIHIAETDVA